MAVGAGLGAATGAASGGLKGALVGAVGGAAGAAVKSFTGGAVTVGLSYSAENGFGASVGVGYGPATVSLGISERGGTTVDLGLKKGGFNAGLSYNSKTGSVSGNAGFTSSQSGTGFALSYNEGDGFGASISKSLDSGVNGSLSWSQKGGVGGSIGYEAPGDKNQPKNSLANQMKGAGGSLSFNQRDGVSASVSASGGVNAGNWSQSGGFQANTNFLADQWKADFQSGKAQEDAAAQEASRAAQNKNNAEQGASNIAAAGVTVGRREDGETLSMKPLSHENVGDGVAYGNPGINDSGQTIASSGSFGPDGKPVSQKPGVQADGSIVVVGSSKPTLGERASSLFGSVAEGAKGLWDRVAGGSQKSEHSNSATTSFNSGIYEKDGIRMPYEFDSKRGDIPFSDPRSKGPHGAIDFIVPEGTPVRAVADGVVGKVHDKPDNFLNNADPNKQNKTLGGAAINLMHNNGNGGKLTTYYAHNSQILVKPGDPVKKGDIIAYSGNSGNSGKPHSHYTIYLNGNYNTPTDPQTYNWDKEFYGK
ncbi:peptidase, M23 family [Leptospira santarosai str. 2000027870]|nr:peptidase, M23 family [Leptospira santarosai str. 2000027870]